MRSLIHIFFNPFILHVQVDILMDVPMHDPLYNTKVVLLKRHCVQTKGKSSTVYSSVRHFTIKFVLPVNHMIFNFDLLNYVPNF